MNWAVLRVDLVKGFNSFLEGSFFPIGLNSTNLVLIPKVSHPTSMMDFCPIALCNVAYKIFSKALSNRQKPFLPLLISESQSAFVPNRLIHDNIVIAHDLLHVLKSKKHGDSCSMAVKLDMAKAYGRLTSNLLNFWWSGEAKSNKIKWISCDTLCKSKNEGGLGFKNVEAFNLALLAKLTWRMETGDDTLRFKSFKSKYFKNCNFVDAPHKSGASWVWKSILSAREIIQKGMRWHIGDGSKVNCWKDNWLPATSNFSVTSKNLAATFSSVADLINHSSYKWKSDLVSQYFNLRDQSFILQIPLSSIGEANCKIWGPSKDGKFSVKSAYYITLSVFFPKPRFVPLDGCSFDPVRSGLWNQVWKIRAHQKIKLFLWQCNYERIPVNNLFFLRGVFDRSCCLFCELEVETVDHLLCTCPFACMVWKLSPVRLDFNADFSSFWPKRNDLIFKQKRWDPFDAAQKAHIAFQEFQEISRQNQLLSPPSSPSFVLPQLWTAPATGFFKLNFDAAFNSARKTRGGGLILRESLLLVKHWGYKDMIVEGDCKSVLNFHASVEALMVIFNDFKSLLKVCAGSSLAWVPRRGNVVAHVLSKKTLLAECGDFEWSIWPKWLLDALFPECSSCSFNG
ncbi:uncharacterized protein LOC132309531 [Cornus florida]|uniref:uncharacterized protein LOC132309531 n=1 Tax=Cornus florida TaxID=4283 RepID=UPI0028A0BB1C|nr:uncharacterized protein LOC132309531 [Cornus florida]